MSHRDEPVVITTMGRRVDRSPRPRVGLGGALAIGVGLLFFYAVISLLFHILAATILWLPALIAAGYASSFAGRKGIHGLPRLAIGIIVLLAVRAVLLAL